MLLTVPLQSSRLQLPYSSTWFLVVVWIKGNSKGWRACRDALQNTTDRSAAGSNSSSTTGEG